MKPRILFLCVLLLVATCGFQEADSNGVSRDERDENDKIQRGAMVRVLKSYGIKDQRVLKAMGKVRRHLYIPESYRRYGNAYGDHPCPIGYNQTISQPYIVAYMTEKMAVQEGEKVLEIGTGSGYQAAILAELGARVFSVELIGPLAQHARSVLKAEGYGNVKVLRGDGYQGWAEHAPYDIVIVTCAPHKIPEKLTEQLKEGGRMILPVGRFFQRLVILKKKKGKIIRINDLSVRFVPMVREKK